MPHQQQQQKERKKKKMKRFQTIIDLSETPDDNEEGEEEIKPWPWANWTTIDWLLGLATILYIAGGATSATLFICCQQELSIIANKA